MVFRETALFTRQADALLGAEALRALQLALLARPDAGAVIPGGGGVRKLRWAASGRGTRGGVRVLYYWATADGVVLCLACYAKAAQADIPRAQLAILRGLIAAEFP
jgi:putative component of toxin-antitoxin plasmid stabilization module